MTLFHSESIEVPDADEGSRLDQFLAKRIPNFSRVKLRQAISAGQITIDGNKAKPAYRLNPGQKIICKIEVDPDPVPEPENIPLDVIYEDEHLVVINKPPGMVVHPSKGHWSGTLTAALSFRFQQLSDCGGEQRPGIVHRLDRDTSGVIVVAKTNDAHLALSSQFEQRTVEKEYYAVVSPVPERDRDWIDQPIGIHPYQREKMAIRKGDSKSRDAKTFYEVEERFLNYSTVRVFPKTGRTHQIRVHFQHIGCPVVADKLYSGTDRIIRRDLEKLIPYGNSSGKEESESGSTGDEVLISRQALHARRIRLNHPINGESVQFEAPIPQDISTLIRCLPRKK